MKKFKEFLENYDVYIDKPMGWNKKKKKVNKNFCRQGLIDDSITESKGTPVTPVIEEFSNTKSDNVTGSGGIIIIIVIVIIIAYLIYTLS